MIQVRLNRQEKVLISLIEQAQDAMSELIKEKERLECMLSNIRENIAEIKSRYPYTVKEVVEDPNKEQQRRGEIEEILKQYEELKDIYQGGIM